MGRSPCCDKIGLKKGPWTPEEDQKLLAYIDEHGHGSWRALPTKAGLERCGKSCRLRWTNYLRPDIKRGKFSLQEEQTIIQLHALLGNRWSAIATHLPKRTDNEIKNYWNTHLKKRLAKMGIDPVTHKPKNDSILSNDDGRSKNEANLSHMAQWESARLEAEARLVKQSKLRSVSVDSVQAQSSEFASSSSQPKMPMGSTQCLNALDTWNTRVWGHTNETAGETVLAAGIGGDLESLSSTLSSATRVRVYDGGIMKEGNGEWKQSPEYREDIGNSIPFTATASEWGSQSMGGDSNSEHVPRLNFVENFTDLLLSTSSGISLSKGGEDEGGGSGGGGGSDYYEDNKTYWNSILNIVNSSPTHSPIF